MLSSNMILWEYITVILAFCNRRIVSHAFAYTSFSGPSAMSTEERTMNTEQRINPKCLVRLGKTPPQALEMLQQVYGDNTVMSRTKLQTVVYDILPSCRKAVFGVWSRTCVFEWRYKRFKAGREDVEDGPRSGRPSTSRTKARS